MLRMRRDLLDRYPRRSHIYARSPQGRGARAVANIPYRDLGSL